MHQNTKEDVLLASLGDKVTSSASLPLWQTLSADDRWVAGSDNLAASGLAVRSSGLHPWDAFKTIDSAVPCFNVEGAGSLELLVNALRP